MSSRREILQYMRENLEDHRDYTTDEINYTFLAEDACSKFSGYDENGDIPEEYFEWALEVGESVCSRRPK